MAMEITTFKTRVKQAYIDAQKLKDGAAAAEFMAAKITEAVEKLLKSATVKVIADASSIVTTGSATTQMNASPITFVGNEANNGGIS
jgi:hypothetical protein